VFKSSSGKPNCTDKRFFSASKLGVELEALGVELEALGVELEALGAELEALGAELEALGAELEALGAELEKIVNAGAISATIAACRVSGVMAGHAAIQ